MSDRKSIRWRSRGSLNILDSPQYHSLDAMSRAMQNGSDAQFPSVPLERWQRPAAAQYREAYGRLHLRYDTTLRRAILEAAATEKLPDMWLFLDASKPFPVISIHGATSDGLNLGIIARMTDRQPDMIIAHVPDRGHCPFLDELESLSVIRQILDLVT